MCHIFQVVQEYERAVIFRLGRLMQGGAKGPGEYSLQVNRWASAAFRVQGSKWARNDSMQILVPLAGDKNLC